MPKLFEGYVRRAFFDRRLLEFTVLVVLVLAGALYLFPRHRVLVQFYLDRGLNHEAIAVITDMIRQRPGDIDLMLLRAEALKRADDPDGALVQFQQVLTNDPRNREALAQIALFHEWNRNLAAAIKTLEALADADPGNLKVLGRLREHYAYIGLTDRETDTVVRLVHLEKLQPLEVILPGLDDPAYLAMLMRDPLPRVAARQMQRLALQRRFAGAEPLRDELLRRLYSLRANFLWLWGKAHEIGPPNAAAALGGFLESLVATGQIETALAFAEQVDQIWPQRPRAVLHLAQVLRRFEYRDQATALLAQVGRDYGGDRQVQLHLVDIARAAGDLDAAAQTLEQLVAEVPDQTDYRHRLVDLYLEMNRPLRAFQVLHAMALSSGLDRDQLGRLVEIAGYTARPGPAAEAADRVRGLVPPDPDLLFKAAGVLTAAGDLEGATGVMADYLQLRPADAQAVDQLALLYLWTEKPANAYGLYKQLYLAGTGGAQRVQQMLAAATASGDAALVREAGAIARQLNDPELLLQAAQALVGAGDLHGAIATFNEYLKNRPADRVAWDQLARLYLWTGQPLAHARLLVQAAQADPTSGVKLRAAGNALVQAGQLAQGMGYLERALALRPDRADLWQRLALYAGWANLPDKQVEVLEKLAAMGPLPDDQALVLAQAYLNRGQAARVLALLEPLAQQGRLTFDSSLVLAAAYQAAGQIGKADKLFKSLADQHHANGALLAELGNRALWAKRLALALDLYEKALRRDPRNLVALKGSAQIYAWNNDAQKAMARFETYNRLVPDDHEARYLLGELYFANGRTGDAIDQYDKTLAIIRRAGPDGIR